MSDSLEDRSLVLAYERCLEDHKAEVLAHSLLVTEKYGQAGVSKLGCSAWPLRPIFVDRAKLEFIGRSIYDQLVRCKARLLELVRDVQNLAETVRFPSGMLTRLDLSGQLESPDFLSAVRPDGFLFPDRFVLSEYNVGSGLLATLSYTEVLYELLLSGPMVDHLKFSPTSPARPFLDYVQMLKRRCGEKEAPHLCLFSPKSEMKELYSWETELFERLFLQHGFSVSFADEDDLILNSEGQLSDKRSSNTLDLLVQMTTGEHFITNPESLDAEHSFLRGPSAGTTPHIHPLSCLLLGKGVLPARLACDENPYEGELDFRLEQDISRFVEEKDAAHYRINKDQYVIKRSWTGKDTVVGCSTSGRAWNRIVADALNSTEFIIQEYCSLPKVELPFLIGREIEYLPVRFELSPFLIEGVYSGGLVRYAPDAEGVRLSPAPANLGMTIVC